MKKRRKMSIAERQSYVHYNPKRVRKVERLLRKFYEAEIAKNKTTE